MERSGALTWKRFAADARASVAVIFAVTLIPVLGLLAVAIDYSRGAQAHADLQAAVDAAALAAGKVALNENRHDVQEVARNVFDAGFQRSDPVRLTTFSATTEGDLLKIEARAEAPTFFPRFAGAQGMQISASARVPITAMAIEVVLVLDNTGSMAGTKMEELKKSAQNLIDMIEKGSAKNHATISLVPFHSQVNAGLANHPMFSAKAAEWFRWEGPGSQEPVLRITKAAWQAQGPLQGCVSDRDKPYDVQRTLPSTNIPTTLYPAANCQYPGLVPVVPLTKTFSNLRLAIGYMNPTGNTNTEIGLAWGLAMLTPGAPLSTAQASNKDLRKTIVFLTDGINTQSRHSQTAVEIDQRTNLLCDEIRTATISLYTVRLVDGNETLLRNCATTPDMYYNVRQASELDEVFKKIAGEITTLRLAR
jgi:Flp pilus assembly protein TadG